MESSGGKIELVRFNREFARVLDVLQIVNYPHPVLRYVSRPVTEIDDGLRETVRSMFELLYAAKGIGLAANQVALPFRFFMLNLTADPAQADKEQVFINPVITKRHLRSRTKRAA